MENTKNVSIELNEKELFNIIEFSKDEKINPNNLIKFLLYLLIILIILFLYSIIYLLINIKYYKGKIEKIEKNMNQHNTFDIIEYYKKSQDDFCQNPSKYINMKIENEIALFDVKFNELKYQIYIYKSFNWVLKEVRDLGYYEKNVSNNIIEASKFYGKKNNILYNKDIFIIDIGGNIGWYPSLLGRYGFSIISFEALKKIIMLKRKIFVF